MENYLSVPAAEQGLGTSLPLAQKHFSLLNSTQGEQKFGHSRLGAQVPDPRAHGLFVFHGSEHSSPSPSPISAAWCCGSRGSLGAALPALQLRRWGGAGSGDAERGPPAPGEGAVPEGSGSAEAGRVLLCHAPSLLLASEVEPGRPRVQPPYAGLRPVRPEEDGQLTQVAD